MKIFMALVYVNYALKLIGVYDSKEKAEAAIDAVIKEEGYDMEDAEIREVYLNDVIDDYLYAE